MVTCNGIHIEYPSGSGSLHFRQGRYVLRPPSDPINALPPLACARARCFLIPLAGCGPVYDWIGRLRFWGLNTTTTTITTITTINTTTTHATNCTYSGRGGPQPSQRQRQGMQQLPTSDKARYRSSRSSSCRYEMGYKIRIAQIPPGKHVLKKPSLNPFHY